MRTSLGFLALTAALATASLTASLTAPASAAPGGLRPDALPRGEDPQVPYVVGTTLVDGDTRIRIEGDSLQLLGRSGDAYVVRSDSQVLRVTPGHQERLARTGNRVADVLLSDDGAHLVLTSLRTAGGRTRVQVLGAVTGEAEASRVVTGYAYPVAARGDRVLLSTTEPDRTFWWNHRTDAVRTVIARQSTVADLGSGRLGTLTGDPYQGGCYVVSTIRRPRHALWRSCDEAVIAFSPDGSRMVTSYLLADGLGPGKLWLRRTDGGRMLTTYDAYWFSSIVWESPRALLLDTHTKKRWATLRCVVDDCERASRVRRMQM